MGEATETATSATRTRWLIAAGLFLGTLALYARVVGHPFIFFDDNRYVTENPTVQAGLSWQGVVWAFTTFHVSNWHPLTWLSHMLDVELFGVSPGAHHFVNVLFHGANAVLVFLVFLRMTGATWRSALVAALFAVHPTHVESVAWVAERKDVLSTLFGLLAMLVYAGWTRRGGLGRYVGVVALFAASLLSKPMWVTLPFLLLLLDVWPLQRWAGSPVPSDPGPLPSPRVGFRRLVLEKVPLLAVSIASSIVTVVAQARGGAVADLSLGIGDRLGNAAVAYVRYVGKTIWPANLAIYYPLPVDGIPAWQAVGAAALVIAVCVLSVAVARRAPWLPTGWFWFLGTLVPVIGLLQVGAQAMADRYTYVSTIGLYVIVAWGGAALASRTRKERLAAGASVGVIAALAAVSFVQLGLWSDHVSLFSHALAVEPRNAMAAGILSEGMRRSGRNEEALRLAEEAARLSPGNARHLVNLGLTYRTQGRILEARAALAEAVRLSPEYGVGWLNLGHVELDLGRPMEALSDYERALALGTENATAAGNMGALYHSLGRTADAGRAFERATRLDPNGVAVWWNLGIWNMQTGRLAEAEAAFLEAQRREPRNVGIHRKLEEIRMRTGR